MDQTRVVDIQLDDGMAIVAAFTKAGYDIAAACWLKDSEDRRWRLYLASPGFRGDGSVTARRLLFEAHLRNQKAFNMLTPIRFVAEDHPVVAGVRELQERCSDKVAIICRARTFGDVDAEEVLVLPKVPPGSDAESNPA